MLENIKSFHEKNHVHKDIKPENFRMHGDQVYTIDFGTVEKYIDNGKHVVDIPAAFIGSLFYAS